MLGELLQRLSENLSLWADSLPYDRPSVECSTPAEREADQGFEDLVEGSLLRVELYLELHGNDAVARRVKESVDLVRQAAASFIKACEGVSPLNGAECWSDVGFEYLTNPTPEQLADETCGRAYQAAIGVGSALCRNCMVFQLVDEAVRKASHQTAPAASSSPPVAVESRSPDLPLVIRQPDGDRVVYLGNSYDIDEQGAEALQLLCDAHPLPVAIGGKHGHASRMLKRLPESIRKLCVSEGPAKGYRLDI